MVQCKVDYLQSSQASPLDVLDALEIQNKSPILSWEQESRVGAWVCGWFYPDICTHACAALRSMLLSGQSVKCLISKRSLQQMPCCLGSTQMDVQAFI